MGPGMSQVAAFDTAFHSRMPRVARLYALPRHLAQEGIIRYGFHGLSYEYVMEELRRLEPEAAAGRVVADAAPDSGHARPVAEVRDDDAPGGRLGFETALLLHYVLVGEAVEAVADDALLCELPRKRVEPGDAGHPAVECGVKANYLRDRRVGSAHGFDRRDRVRKMVGIDRYQCPEIGDHLGGDSLRLAVAVPAVDDPVPDRRQVVPVEPPISQPTH